MRLLHSGRDRNLANATRLPTAICVNLQLALHLVRHIAGERDVRQLRVLGARDD
jgi:hypothetical protein